MKRGDSYPELTGTATDALGAVPLGTPTSIKLFIKAPAIDLITIVPTVDNPAAVRNDADCGKWTAQIAVTDFDTIGDYEVELQVEWTAGQIQTFPSDDENNEVVHVKPDLSD